ncbi:myopalladin-like [Penaeus chinensis]|uniref:myopalladin-like n=1 Tax=Penaeus chinensis TaxID=139456 RepID=UPI001FB7AA97|nr:myopalladin-like [Penaeus chinensis]
MMAVGMTAESILFRWLLLLLALTEALGDGSSSKALGRLVSSPLKTQRFISVSESHYDHDHHTHHHHEVVPEPHFAPANTSCEVYLGQTAELDCTVHDLTNESVSWMRRVEDVLELLTWDNHTYVNDDRYQLVHETGDRWQRWQLAISDTSREDVGHYRCKVATNPPLTLDVTLNIIEPHARVVDERGTKVLEKHYNSGSMIELKCVIERVPFPPAAVTWRRDATLLSFNTSRGGISLKSDEAAGYLSSRLYVANATPGDSGRYTCWYGNYTSDTVTVHVIPGENSQAMQHDTLPGAADAGDGASAGGSGCRGLAWGLLLGALAATCFNCGLLLQLHTPSGSTR